MIVFCGHVFCDSPIPAIVGGAGVTLFFVLSGYQIGRGFKTGRYTARSYLWKRFCTVCIPYFVLISILLLTMFPTMIRDDPMTVLRLFTFTYAGNLYDHIDHLWFISVIMQLYIMALLFNIVISRIKGNINVCRIVFVILIISGYMVRNMASDLGISDSYYHVYSHFDAFFAAYMLSYMGLRTGRSAVLKVISVVLLSFLYIGRNPYIGDFDLQIYRTAVVLIALLFIVAFDSNVRKGNDPLTVSAVRSNPARIIEALSVISFSFYMWHLVILHTYWRATAHVPSVSGDLLAFAVSFPLSCIFGAIWYLFIETKVKDVKIRYQTNNG